CVYKVLSAILETRLSSYLESTKALPDEQHGFRAGRSTITACRVLMDEIQNTLEVPKRFLYPIFVDFRAAFDLGSRTLVLKD
ncbi:hypothetical protein GUG51_34115, partial [Xanthomonas citri pv. citri]|nr:hypothetical protein [Xanthomonas citri pv. citri]